MRRVFAINFYFLRVSWRIFYLERRIFVSERPGIILKSKFTLPNKSKKGKGFSDFAKYATYIARDEALDSEQSDEIEIQDDEYRDRLIDQSVLEKNKDSFESEQGYDKMMGYYFRSQALEDKKDKDDLEEKEKIELELLYKSQDKLLQENTLLQKRLQRQQRDRQKISGAFSKDTFDIYGKDLKTIRKKIRKAQKAGSVHWQHVVSFDNNFLEEKGFYDSKTGKLSEVKLKKASKDMMETLEKKEGLQDHYWYGAIHRNTDNIHIHLSSVELSPSRKIQEHDGVENPRGKLKPKTLDKMKSSFGESLLEWAEVYKQISNLREQTRQLPETYKKFGKKFFGESEYQKEMIDSFIDLDGGLPDNWDSINKYGNVIGYNTLSDKQKKLVDRGIEVIKKYDDDFRKRIEEWEDQLDQHHAELIKAFGESENPQKDFKENRQADMKARLGNAMLKEFAKKKKDNNIDKRKEYNCRLRGYFGLKVKKKTKYSSMERYLYKLKKQDERRAEQRLKKVVEEQKREDLSAYEEMMKDVEQEKQQQGHEF